MPGFSSRKLSPNDRLTLLLRQAINPTSQDAFKRARTNLDGFHGSGGPRFNTVGQHFKEGMSGSGEWSHGNVLRGGGGRLV